jgi:DNA-binding response OmpR family regulator
MNCDGGENDKDRDAGRLRLMIVEDDGIAAMTLKDLMEDLGYRVTGVVADVETAIAFLNFADRMPDAVILDADLKGRSSAPVARCLRDADIPFIVTSGFGDRHLAEIGLDGVTLSKPYTVVGLQNAMSALLGSGEKQERYLK